MTDRTVTVRLKADISDFVTDIGVKAVAAVKTLERAASDADKRIGKVGASNDLDKLGSKAEAVGAKLDKAGAAGESSGKKISSSASKADGDLKKLADTVDKVNKSTDEQAKSIDRASKSADAHANAIGRLRVAQLRLAEVQSKSNPSAATVAGAEESVKAAERAVKKFEKAGDGAGKGFVRRFGSAVKGWFTGDGTSIFKQLGQNVGGGFLASLMGILKTPVIGPIVTGLLIAAIESALVPAGAVLAGGIVAGFGTGLAVLGSVFAAKSAVIKSIWSKTASDLGAESRTIAKPFESTLVAMSLVARRTFAGLKPELAAVFSTLAPAVAAFGDHLGQALQKLGPALQPLAGAFKAVLGELGPALNDVFAQLSSSLTRLSESVSKNPTALADFARGLGGLIGDILNFLRIMNDADAAFKRWTGGTSAVTAFMWTLRGVVEGVLGPIGALAFGLSKVGDGMNWLAGKLGIGTQVMDQSSAAATAEASSLAHAAAEHLAHANAAAHSAHATHEANVAAALLAGAYDRQAAATQKAIDALNRESTLLLSLSGAQIGYQQAVDDTTAAIKANGHTHDLNTQKGRDNQTQLNTFTQSVLAQRDAMLKANDGNVKAAAAAETGRAAFIRFAMQMKYSKAEATAMADSLIKIPNVTRTAKLNADITDLESKLATAKQKLKDPHLTAEQKATLTANISKLQAGIAEAKAELASLPASKSVTINMYRNMVETTTHLDKGVRTVNADGGYYPKGIPSYADGKLPSQATIAPGKGGGMVQWAEQETGGEAFIPLAPSKRDRSTKILGQVAGKFGMGLVQSFANGGFTLPGGNLVDVAYLLQQLGIPFNPTAGINYTSSLAAANRANRAVVPARNNAIAADKAEQAAKATVAQIQRAITLQQRAVADARKGTPKTKAGQAAEDRKVAEEQKKLIALQDQLYAAKIKVTKATKASNAADAVYKARAEAAAKATEAHKAAIEALIQQQQAAVEMASQISQGLTSGANIGDLFQKSLTGKGLLADLQGEGADLKKFGGLIASLRKQGLNEVLIQQIVGKGATDGIDIAQAILDGGASLVASLNKAQANLTNQANLIGAGSANVKYGTKVAGARAGGGDVQAGKTYQVNENGREYFTAPIDGHVVPAGQDPRRYIQSMTGGGNWGSGPVVKEVNNHQSLHFTGVSMAEADLIASRAQAKLEFAARS